MAAIPDDEADADGGRCLDENELAALCERRLVRAERDRLERHLDDCRECRELVAAVARSIAS